MFKRNDKVIYSNTGNTYRVVKVEGNQVGVYRQNKNGGDVGRYMMIDSNKCELASRAPIYSLGHVEDKRA